MSGKRGIESKWHINNVFKQIDSFAKEVPSFNLRGQEKVNTIVGGFVTILILIIIFLYANLKLTQLITGANPVISQ